MKTVAGLFDSMADATNAMDILLREDIPDLDTRVFETGSATDTANNDSGVVVPLIPNSGSGMDFNAPAGVGAAGLFGADWLDDLDEVERAFYHEGFKEGATLAVAHVPDDHVTHVRRIFADHNARTYKKD